MSEPGELVYLCLQQTVEGQASHAHVHEIIAGLERRGWRVSLYEIQADRSRQHGRLYYLAHYLAPQWKLWRGGRRPRAVYIRSDALALPGFLWARLRGIPVIQELNGPADDRAVAKPWTRPLVPVFTRLLNYQLKRSAAIIAVTPELARWVGEATGKNNVHVVPNGANTELFRPGLPRPAGLPERYVAFVGLLAPWQGMTTLLEAARHPDWPAGVSLVIAGDGTGRSEIERARDSARGAPIHYLGVLPYHQVPGLLANSLAGLSLKTSLPGRPETGMSPLKLYETLACGVPAIVTEYPGQSDVVRQLEAGLIVPQDDPAALARAVGWVATHETERAAIGRRAADAVAREHSWDQRAGRIHEIIESVTGSPASDTTPR
jgi:glycosyltransferase involved in cell wall biosynthesis